MKSLSITIIQHNIIWEDPKANINLLDKKITQISDTDLIILPEMFATGFTMHVKEFAQSMNGSLVKWLKKKALKKSVDIVGSIITKQKNQYFNRLIWATSTGEIYTYDKRHLFRMAGEDKAYAYGTKHLTVNIKNWKISPFICYDLRFPCWLRNYGNYYDIALFIANWPQKRIYHWQTLLKARAIENQCYTIGVNRVGEDKNKIQYNGNSMVIAPDGEVLLEKDHTESVTTILLSKEVLEKTRKYFPVWKDADFSETPFV
jgi:predicted amidohydrolase